MTTRESRLLVLKLVVAAGLLYLIFSRIPLSGVLQTVMRADPWLVILGVLTLLVTVAISAMRIGLLVRAQGMSISLARLSEINLISRFYGLFLPGTIAGGAIRWHRIVLEEPDKKAETAASIAYARLILYAVTFGLGGLFAALALADTGSRLVWPPLLALIVGLPVLGYAVFHGWPVSVHNWLVGRDHRWARLVRDISRRFRAMRPVSLASVYASGAAEILLAMLAAYFFAMALRIDITFGEMAWILAAVSIATSLPITVSGLGIREGSLLVLMGTYGVSDTAALGLSILLLMGHTVLALLGGGFELRRWLSPSRPGPKSFTDTATPGAGSRSMTK